MNDLRNNRIWFVHSLRGVAAVAVMIQHLVIKYWYENDTVVRGFNYLLPKANQDYLVYFNIVDTMNAIHFNLGSFGVALFFLISGFVIPISLKKTRKATFLINRIFRIYPTYIIGFSITFATIYLYTRITGNDFSYHVKNYSTQILLIRDWFWLPSIDGVSWTLETEIKFYMLIWLIWVFGRLNQPKAIAITTVMLCGVNILLHNKYDFLLHNNIRVYQIVYILTYSNISLAFMFLGVCFYNYHTGNWGLKEFIVTIQVVFISFVFSFLNGPNKNLIANYAISYSAALLVFINAYLLKDVLPYHKVVSFLADISYPLYVVHGVNGYIILNIFDVHFHFNPYVAMAISFTFAITLAYLLHKFVEEPANALGKRRTQESLRIEEEIGIPTV